MEPVGPVTRNIVINPRNGFHYHSVPIGINPQITWVLLLAIVKNVSWLRAQDLGTTAIATFNRNEIILGADSKSSPPRGAPRNICKIRTYGNFYVVAAGVFGLPGSEEYDAWGCFREASRARGLIEFAHLAEACIAPKLTPVLRQMETNNPAWYKEHVGNIPLAYVAASIDSLKLVYMERVFSDGQKTMVISGDKTPYGALSSDRDGRFTILGHHEALRPEAPELRGKSTTEMVRWMIQQEINATPDAVGPPISILALYPAGPHWIQNGECKQ